MGVDGFDPFLDTFRILLLPDLMSLSIRPLEHKKGIDYFFCFDEAQCELLDQLGNGRQHSFNAFLKDIHFIWPKDGMSPLVAAGTSLQLLQFQDFVEGSITQAFNSWANLDEDDYNGGAYRIASSQATITITDDAQFMKLLKNHVS
jgi:hypothetical protein